MGVSRVGGGGWGATGIAVGAAAMQAYDLHAVALSCLPSGMVRRFREGGQAPSISQPRLQQVQHEDVITQGRRKHDALSV